MSRDHDWGLRLTLLVGADLRDSVARLLDQCLPDTFDGHPTRLELTGQHGPVVAVEVESAGEFARSRLGLDPRQGMDSLDWLSVTGQAVLEVVAGPVFHDSAGEITGIRERLQWYPDDVWRYVMAADWARLAEEMPLMSRAGHRGDDLGSRVIAARMVDVAMHLGLLLERQWAPYAKWRGTAFGRLPRLQPVLAAICATLRAATWPERQERLAAALDALHRIQRGRGLSHRPAATVAFHDRPYLHPDPGIIGDLRSGVTDPHLLRLPRGRGSIEQQTDNVALLMMPTARRAVIASEPESA
jgi:hypothetical protein